MAMASYRIFGLPGDWHVEHDGKVANSYETKESAFEAAAAAASIALRQGARDRHHRAWQQRRRGDDRRRCAVRS
jgi:hypothetical protein